MPTHLSCARGALYQRQPLSSQQPQRQGLRLVVIYKALVQPVSEPVQPERALAFHKKPVFGDAGLANFALLGGAIAAVHAGQPLGGVQHQGQVGPGAHLMESHPGAGQGRQGAHAQDGNGLEKEGGSLGWGKIVWAGKEAVREY
jgi:hypothetical protein